MIGERCIFGQNCLVADGVVIGDNVKVQNNVSLYTGTVVEDDVFLGPSCVLTNVTNPRSQVNRHDLYEILPLLSAVMNELESRDGEVLHLIEDALNVMPGFITSRGDVFDYLHGSVLECLRQ